jgi:hypothetical protein
METVLIVILAALELYAEWSATRSPSHQVPAGF